MRVMLWVLVPRAKIKEVGSDLIQSATLCHDDQIVGLYLGSKPVHPTVLAAKSMD